MHHFIFFFSFFFLQTHIKQLYFTDDSHFLRPGLICLHLFYIMTHITLALVHSFLINEFFSLCQHFPAVTLWQFCVCFLLNGVFSQHLAWFKARVIVLLLCKLHKARNIWNIVFGADEFKMLNHKHTMVKRKQPESTIKLFVFSSILEANGRLPV